MKYHHYTAWWAQDSGLSVETLQVPGQEHVYSKSVFQIYFISQYPFGSKLA